MLQKQLYVPLPFPQRRYEDRKCAQPVIQIPAETSVLHPLLQALICGRHNTHVHINDLISAYTHDFPLLQNTQKLYLHGHAHSLDLIQKQSSLMGKLKKAGTASFFCPGKSTFLIAKKLAFQKIFRHGGYIDGHKRAISAAGGQMNCVSENFLSGSCLSDQKYGRFRLGHAL